MIYKIAAFTKDPQGGNLAGVVLNANLLTAEQMLKIAGEAGFSETVFLMASSKADFRTRFFTPIKEVDLCGHATVAAFNLLRDLKVIKTRRYTQATNAGVLPVEVMEKCIYMEQNPPKFFATLSAEEITGCFFNSEEHYLSALPIQIVSTGLKDIILPVKDLKTLLELKPNLQRIKEITTKWDVIGIHAFSLETLSGVQAHTRNFAPAYGIDEESATGTANGALACYLLKNGFKNREFIIEQGHILGRPSKIKVRLKLKDDKITQVLVGGKAVLLSKKSLF